MRHEDRERYEDPRFTTRSGGWFRQWYKRPGIGPHIQPTMDEYWAKTRIWMDPERPYDWAFDGGY